MWEVMEEAQECNMMGRHVEMHYVYLQGLWEEGEKEEMKTRK